MKVALVNPPWDYANSIYFGCREPHLPLELGYARQLLFAAGHEALLVDCHAMGLDARAAADLVAQFAPGITVVVTAPSYLFWRCAPPELRSPRRFLDKLGARGGLRVVAGPHASVTPAATLSKLDADLAIRGECEEAIVELANDPCAPVAGTTRRALDGTITAFGAPRAIDMATLPALRWEPELIARHAHHHHRFGGDYQGPGAEVEASRGCPYSCTFCAKLDYRDAYRRRPLEIVLDEIDALIAQGVTYVYFIDEIFLPNRPLLEALAERPLQFGVQTRIDLWKPALLDLLGRAGCVSIEAGVESLTGDGRDALAKKCRLSTDELADLLIHARRTVGFVQANLIQSAGDDPALVVAWRERLQRHGVWANDPVPLYPYPSSPEYRRLFGLPDDRAWERAHTHYLQQFPRLSELQDDRPLPLRDLEATCHH